MNLKNLFLSGFKVFCFSSIVLFSIISLYCQNKPDNTNYNPENLIAKEINERKIVIIGEAPHSHPSGYNEVIKILYEWLEECRRTGNNSQTLNLVLEIDDSLASLSNKYLKTGILSSLIDSNITLASYETIEFFTKLRNFSESLDSLKNKYPKSNLKFNVLGFEESVYNFNSEFFKKTTSEIQYWFVKDRDSVVSQKFINYFTKNRNDKYLIYYGLSHLQKGYVNKKMPGFSIKEDSCYGYYLAGYLKKEFGENNVITIAKEMMPPQSLKRIGLDSLINKYYLAESQNLKLLNNSQKVDYFFLNPYIEVPNHFFGYVYSRKVFEKALEKFTLYEKSKPGTWLYDFVEKKFKELSYSTGNIFNNASEFKVWLNNQKTFDLSHFDTKEYKDYLYKSFSNDKNARAILKQLGFENNIDDYNSMDTAEWNNKIWPEALKNIKFINAIGIYWAGYPDEKINAREFLKNFSGEDYSEPEKYLQWWRNVYHNYGI
jgi:hypothetical protein